MFGCLARLAGAAAPAAATARQWLLRLGLSLLRRAGGVVRGGWTLLIDHTLAQGACKCFAVVGLPTEDLRSRGYALSLRDVSVLAVEVMEPSSGEQVEAVLRQVLARVGAITQVVCDHGSDLLKGVAGLQADHPEVVATYDVRHLLAWLLKRQLAGCPRWQAFLGHCGRSLPKVRQTAGNFLAPPVLRLKARYMNLEAHVAWASRLLAWEQQGDWPALGRLLGERAGQARAWFEETFGWLKGFAADVGRWADWLGTAAVALAEVHQGGLSRQTAGRFWLRWLGRGQPRTFAGERFAQQVKEELAREGTKLAPGQRGLGSSDVIESLFGRYKEVMTRGPTGALTANVLLLPLMAGEGLTNEQIKAGLEDVSAADVRLWVKEQLGESDRAKKQGLFAELPTTRDEPGRDPEVA